MCAATVLLLRFKMLKIVSFKAVSIGVVILFGFVECFAEEGENFKPGDKFDFHGDPHYMTSGGKGMFHTFYTWLLAIMCSVLMSAVLQAIVYVPQWVMAGIEVVNHGNVEL